MIEHGPFAVMHGAPWNVLDSRGARIAICGGDSNADWEKHGPAIAAEIVTLLNEALPDDGEEIDEPWLLENFPTREANTKRLAFVVLVSHGVSVEWCPCCGPIPSCICFNNFVAIRNATRGQLRTLIRLLQAK